MHVSAFIWSLRITINKDGWSIYISFCFILGCSMSYLTSLRGSGFGEGSTSSALNTDIFLLLINSLRVMKDQIRALPKDGIKPLTLFYFLCYSKMEKRMRMCYNLPLVEDLKGALPAQQYHHSDKTLQSENTAWLLPLIQMRTCSEYLTKD